MIKLSLPNIHFTYATIGSELLGDGQFQKSILPLKKAIIINPGNSAAQNDLIKALFKLGKENEAFSYLKKGLSLNPELDTLHYLLITELKERDRLEDLEAFSKEVANMIVDPKSVPIFYFASAEALVRCDLFPQALGVYRKTVENHPPVRFDHHYHYGLTLYREGQLEEAIVQFEHARGLNSNSNHVWNSIAYLNYCLGRVQKAKEEFEYIIQNGMEINLTYPNFLLVLLHLDESEEVINQYKERLKQSTHSDGSGLPKLYDAELRTTQILLDRDDIDEKTREFNIQKLKNIKQVLSFLDSLIAEKRWDSGDGDDGAWDY